MIAASYSAATSTSVRVGAAPRVVEHVGPGLADRPTHRRPPGVDADHHVGVGRAHAFDEPDRAPLLLLDVDLGARSRLDAADVDDLGPLLDDLGDPVERLVLRPGRTLVVEGVRGPVDDRHHQPLVIGERVPAETERHVLDPATPPIPPSGHSMYAVGRRVGSSCTQYAAERALPAHLDLSGRASSARSRRVGVQRLPARRVPACIEWPVGELEETGGGRAFEEGDLAADGLEGVAAACGAGRGRRGRGRAGGAATRGGQDLGGHRAEVARAPGGGGPGGRGRPGRSRRGRGAGGCRSGRPARRRTRWARRAARTGRVVRPTRRRAAAPATPSSGHSSAISGRATSSVTRPPSNASRCRRRRAAGAGRTPSPARPRRRPAVVRAARARSGCPSRRGRRP